MDTTEIVKGALAIVGVTQILKSFLPFKKGWLWAIITIMVGIGISFVPIKYLNVVISVSAATLFYDTIFQAFKKLFERLSMTGTVSANPTDTQTDTQER